MRTRREIMAVTAATSLGFIASSGNAFGKAPETRAGFDSTASNDFKCKLSLAAYSYRQLLTGTKPELTLTDFIDDCAKFGLDGTELTSYYFPASPTPEFLYQLKSHSFRKGLDISGTAIRNDFGFADGAKREENIAHVKAWIDYAEMMGTSVIRVFAGAPKKRHLGTGDSPINGRWFRGMLRLRGEAWRPSCLRKSRWSNSNGRGAFEIRERCKERLVRCEPRHRKLSLKGYLQRFGKGRQACLECTGQSRCVWSRQKETPYRLLANCENLAFRKLSWLRRSRI